MHELMLMGLQRRHWLFTTGLSEERFIDEPFFIYTLKKCGWLGENIDALSPNLTLNKIMAGGFFVFVSGVIIDCDVVFSMMVCISLVYGLCIVLFCLFLRRDMFCLLLF